MRKFAITIAAVMAVMTTLGGVASANNGGGGVYPPNPVIIVVQNPTVPYGEGFWAKGKGLCPGGKAFFAIQSVEDPTKVFFTPEIPVNADGTVFYTFTPADLAGFVGQITVFVKQRDICNLTASTIVTIVKQTAPPIQSPSVWVDPSTVKLGDDFTAYAKKLCQGTVIFAVQSTSDWTKRFFSPPVPVNPDGTASYTFDDLVLPGGAGTYTVYAKQPQCNIVTTTVITVVKHDHQNGSTLQPVAPVVAPLAVDSKSVVPAATIITPQVLSAGLTAPAAQVGSVGRCGRHPVGHAARDGFGVERDAADRTRRLRRRSRHDRRRIDATAHRQRPQSLTPNQLSSMTARTTRCGPSSFSADAATGRDGPSGPHRAHVKDEDLESLPRRSPCDHVTAAESLDPCSADSGGNKLTT